MRLATSGNAVTLLALSLAISGCSVLLMDKPPAEVGESYPVCSDEPLAPIADLAIAALAGLAAYELWRDYRHAYETKEDDRNAVIAFGSVTAVYAISAGLGFRWMSRCSDRRDEWQARHVDGVSSAAPRPSTAVPPPPPRGADGLYCYRNETCNSGLDCDLRTFTCHPPPAPPASP